MTRDEIAVQTAALISTITKRPAVSIQESDLLISGGLIDSFHLVDLAMSVEDAFGVVIADTELDGQTFDTFASLVELIASRM